MTSPQLSVISNGSSSNADSTVFLRKRLRCKTKPHQVPARECTTTHVESVPEALPQADSQSLSRGENVTAHSISQPKATATKRKHVFVTYNKDVALGVWKYRALVGRREPCNSPAPKDISTSFSGTLSPPAGASSEVNRICSTTPSNDHEQEGVDLHPSSNHDLDLNLRGSKRTHPHAMAGPSKRAFCIKPSTSNMIVKPSVQSCVPVDDAPTECPTHNTRESCSLAISCDLDT